MIENCVFIGKNAGVDVIDADGLIIIGDDIRSVPDEAKLVIGKSIFGQECNLAEILSSYIKEIIKWQ